MMGVVAAQAVEMVLSSRYGWLIPAILALITLAVIGGDTSVRDTNEARTLWLAECPKPIDECASAWDRSYTLRDLYRERAAFQ